MAKRGFNARLLKWLTAVAVGGSVFQLGSCNPAVRSTLLSGLETSTSTLATTVISAFFQGLQNDDATSTPLTTP